MEEAVGVWHGLEQESPGVVWSEAAWGEQLEVTTRGGADFWWVAAAAVLEEAWSREQHPAPLCVSQEDKQRAPRGAPEPWGQLLDISQLRPEQNSAPTGPSPGWDCPGIEALRWLLFPPQEA